MTYTLGGLSLGNLDLTATAPGPGSEMSPYSLWALAKSSALHREDMSFQIPPGPPLVWLPLEPKWLPVPTVLWVPSGNCLYCNVGDLIINIISCRLRQMSKGENMTSLDLG
jgi:hypothetical protein